MLRTFTPFALASLIAAAFVGVAAGVGGYTFLYADGAAYMTDDPAACANCHIMQEHYSAWHQSSHRAVAVCNDCHAPEPFVSRYLVKARNGWNHSVAFTTGDFPEPLRITAPNRRVTEGQCRQCHQPIVDAIDPPHGGDSELSCIRCHRQVGHPL